MGLVWDRKNLRFAGKIEIMTVHINVAPAVLTTPRGLTHKQLKGVVGNG